MTHNMRKGRDSMELTREQLDKISSFESKEDARAYLDAEGLEVDDQELEYISGGSGVPGDYPYCTHCHAPKPRGDTHCDKCGWQARCPECGVDLTFNMGCWNCGWKAPYFNG